MSDRVDAVELDPAVVLIADDEPLVPVDDWLASLRRDAPLVGVTPAADLLAQARRGE